MQDRMLADAVDGGARSAWQMRGGGGGWRQQRGARGSAAAGVECGRGPWRVYHASPGRLRFVLVGRVVWRGERGERGAAGGRQDAPHADDGLLRVGEVQRVLALHHVQHARVSKVRSDDLTTCSSEPAACSNGREDRAAGGDAPGDAVGDLLRQRASALRQAAPPGQLGAGERQGRHVGALRRHRALRVETTPDAALKRVEVGVDRDGD